VCALCICLRCSFSVQSFHCDSCTVHIKTIYMYFVTRCPLMLPWSVFSCKLASCNLQLVNHPGSFRGRTRRNADSIVEKLSERIGTAFLVLKCLRTHCGPRCIFFPGQNALDFRMIFQDVAYIQSQNFPWTRQIAFGAWTQKPISTSLAGHSDCSCFIKQLL